MMCHLVDFFLGRLRWINAVKFKQLCLPAGRRDHDFRGGDEVKCHLGRIATSCHESCAGERAKSSVNAIEVC